MDSTPAPSTPNPTGAAHFAYGALKSLLRGIEAKPRDNIEAVVRMVVAEMESHYGIGGDE